MLFQNQVNLCLCIFRGKNKIYELTIAQEHKGKEGITYLSSYNQKIAVRGLGFFQFFILLQSLCQLLEVQLIPMHSAHENVRVSLVVINIEKKVSIIATEFTRHMLTLPFAKHRILLHKCYIITSMENLAIFSITEVTFRHCKIGCWYH